MAERGEGRMKRKWNETRDRVTAERHTENSFHSTPRERGLFLLSVSLYSFDSLVDRSAPGAGEQEREQERKQAEFHPVAYFVRCSMKIASGYRCDDVNPKRASALSRCCRGQVTEPTRVFLPLPTILNGRKRKGERGTRDS